MRYTENIETRRRKLTSFFGQKLPLNDEKILNLVNALKDEQNGIKVKNRKYMFKIYENCFVGKKKLSLLTKIKRFVLFKKNLKI
jgi:hypothetical protein